MMDSRNAQKISNNLTAPDTGSGIVADGKKALATPTESGAGVSVAPYKPEYFAQVIGLYKLVFGGQEAKKFAARRPWSQEHNLCPQDTPEWVLLDDNRVVGFLATIPLPYWIGGELVAAHTPSDYMVHPDYRFHGVKLMQAFFKACPSCVSCDDMEATIKVTKWLGAREAGSLSRHTNVLNAGALAERIGLGAMAAPMLWPAVQIMRISRGLWKYGHGPLEKVHALTEFDGRFDAFFKSRRPSAAAMVAKDQRFLEWRYGPHSPHKEREIGAIIDRKGALSGYVVFHLSPDSRTGYVLDLETAARNRARLAASLLSYALSRLDRRGARQVKCYHLAPGQTYPSGLLRGLGFLRRGSHKLLVRFQDPALAKTAHQKGAWSYSYGDSEASHSSI
jgi:hypothetical protein